MDLFEYQGKQCFARYDIPVSPGDVATTVDDPPTGSYVSDASSNLYLGNVADGTRAFSGALDELRLSSVARSPGWLATQFRNQSSPGAFYSISAPLSP